jgi:glucosamine-6-phosphate deaminase
MDVRVVAPGQLDDVGAALVAGWLAGARAATLVAAVGTSPLGVYAGMARLSRDGGLDLSSVRLVQLDEYVGVADDDRRSLYGWLLRDVARPLGVEAARVLRLAGDAPDPAAESRRHDAAIVDAGGLDVSILGLGPNGHLGFNEPPSAVDAATRVVELADASLESNARYWGSRSAVPRRAITVGMDRLLGARRTLLVVRGGAKRAVLRRFVAEPVDDDLPASHLRTISGATLLADSDAWPPDVPVPARLGQ